MGSLLISSSAMAATVCVDIPNEQVPYVQIIAEREGAESVQVYLQVVVSSAVNSWQRELKDAKLQQMKNMLESLSPAAQAELEGALRAQAELEGVTP